MIISCENFSDVHDLCFTFITGLIKSLNGLNISNNPIEFPPKDIMERGTSEILKFLREMLQAKSSGQLLNGKYTTLPTMMGEILELHFHLFIIYLHVKKDMLAWRLPYEFTFLFLTMCSTGRSLQDFEESLSRATQLHNLMSGQYTCISIFMKARANWLADLCGGQRPFNLLLMI